MAHVDITKDIVAQRIQMYQQMMMSKGATAQEALGRAYKLLEGQVMKQAMVLTYADVFLYLGILFLICIPFVLSIKQENQDKSCRCSTLNRCRNRNKQIITV